MGCEIELWLHSKIISLLLNLKVALLPVLGNKIILAIMVCNLWVDWNVVAFTITNGLLYVDKVQV